MKPPSPKADSLRAMREKQHEAREKISRIVLDGLMKDAAAKVAAKPKRKTRHK